MKKKLPRKAVAGEIKYKQICLVNRESSNNVILLFRIWTNYLY